MYYIDIQEDVVARSRELDSLIDSLSRGQVGPEHDAYQFGLAKVFGGGRMLRLGNVLHWLKYRTFNPFLYGGAFSLMIAAVLIAPVSRK